MQENDSYSELLVRLRSLANTKNVDGMARFGINSENTLGIPMPMIRSIAKETKRDHELAIQLWQSGIHEAKILAALVDEKEKVTSEQMDAWVKDFDSWDVCDQVIMNLFDRVPWAYEKAVEWAGREEEFVKRAGYAMMASLAVHDKKASDERFIVFLQVIRTGSTDERNFVKKAVNWALRQIGKRNISLNAEAVKCAREILDLDKRSARWIANDALRELTGEKVQLTLKEGRSRKKQ